MQIAAHKQRSARLISNPDVRVLLTVLVLLLCTLGTVNPGADDALVIVVARDGVVYLEGSVTSIHDLPAGIRDRLHHHSQTVAYIKADRQARIVAINQVLNAIRSAGVDKIYFLVDQRKPQPTAP
jgi:biopolymer transport protein ExbD